MTRRRWIALATVAMLVVAGVLAWIFLLPSDEATKTSVGDAVSTFREESAGGGVDSRGPAPGVYRYATRGGESAQTAILSTSHDYTGVSTIVISPGRCGELERWQVLAERWTEGEACPDGRGDRLTLAREYHEFYGFAQEESFHCRGGSVTRPKSERTGARFSSECRSSDSTVSNRSRLVGLTRIPVGNQTFAAIHTVTDSRIEGNSTGVVRREDWRRRSDGLLLRRSAQSSVESETGGGTHYSESYTLRLLDPKPRL